MQDGKVLLRGSRPSLKEMIEQFERQIISAALVASGGNQRQAAIALGLLPSTLQEKLKRLHLRSPRSAQSARVPASAGAYSGGDAFPPPSTPYTEEQ